MAATIPYAHTYSVLVHDENDRLVFALPFHNMAKAIEAAIWNVSTANDTMGGEAVTLINNRTGLKHTEVCDRKGSE